MLLQQSQLFLGGFLQDFGTWLQGFALMQQDMMQK